MIAVLLARRLQRIRRRRFLFVHVVYCQPLGVAPGWKITGRFSGGREVTLASGPNLRVALGEAAIYADARWDEFGEPLEQVAP